MIKQFLSKTNAAIKARQRLALIIAVLIIGGLVFTAIVLIDNGTPTREAQPQKIQKINITSGGARINEQKMWRYKMEDQGRDLDRKLQDLESNFGVSSQDKQSKMHNIEQQLLELKNNMALLHAQERTPEQLQEQPVIKQIILQLSAPPEADTVRLKTVKNTIPAGTIAPAVLLSGVDASVALSASSNPTPILLRIVDLGVLPRGFRHDVEGCHCIASSYGDLSSERVYARLEKLSCIKRNTGEIIETQVAGFITGPDGKAGIRGRVISKEGKYLARGLIGGIFAGLGRMAAPPAQDNILSVMQDGVTPQAKRSDLFKTGVGEGTGKVLDRLSQYYIERAEQIQPIIQVTAGQKVDLIFTAGVAVGSLDIKQKLQRTRDKSRTIAIDEESNAYE